MIVDAHAHIGVVPGTYDMPPQMQLDAMTRYGIDYALVSDIRAGETQTPPDGHTDFGVQINAEAADIVRRHADRLGLLLWCRPNAEQGYTDAFLHLYEQNRDIVKGLKLHPDIACLPVDDARVQPIWRWRRRSLCRCSCIRRATAFRPAGTWRPWPRASRR